MRNMMQGGGLLGIGLLAVWVTRVAADPGPMVLDLGGGTAMRMARVEPGRFQQGSPPGETGRGADEIQREVAITRGFLIGESPVTVEQWQCFVNETGFRSEAEKGTSGGFGWDGTTLAQNRRFTWRDPGFSQSPEDPVCIITFADAQAFCTWLGRKTGRTASLPTEAQWEYACRAGAANAWHSGATADAAGSGFWHKGNSRNSTHPVSSMAVNPWGIRIGGNVAEWCLDWYAPYEPGAQSDPCQDRPGLGDKPRRVLRGGSWNRGSNNTRCAARWRSDPGSRNADIGFRVACSLDEKPVAPPPAPAPPAESQPPVERVIAPPQAEPMPAEAPAPPMPPRQGAESRPGLVGAVVSLIKGALCLLIPLGLVLWIIRRIVGHGRSANPFVVAPGDPPSLAGVQSGIRKTDDGFWISGKWAEGTRLILTYVVRGTSHSQKMIYQPGPEGQFIYTGYPPQSVSVVTDEGVEAVTDSGPPLLPRATGIPVQRSTMARPPVLRGDRPARQSSPPPMFPPAY